ncbi:CHAT domain-containing protein [Streptomyces sp. NPDC093223]|uniref:CHAT domain-containing protein n=1 Tax=Streptomyces sp. NPDC093223 TaxID=3366033 RepID=UPI00382AFC9A
MLGWTTNIANSEFSEAADWFGKRGDHVSQAWCTARLIEYRLDHNEIRGAETLVREGMADDALVKEPAFLMAAAELHTAVGLHDKAVFLIESALTAGGKPCAEAVVVAATITAHHPERCRGIPTPSLSNLQRFGLIWRGHADAVVQELACSLARSISQAGTGRLDECYALCGLPEQLMILLADCHYGALLRMQSSRGLLLGAMGELYASQGQHMDAALAYLDAFNDFSATHERRPAAESMVRAYCAALESGYDLPDEENHALDCIRAGLQLIETDRLLLLAEDNREAWLTARRDLTHHVFDLLADGRRLYRAKAGELALWLLESFHRSLTVGILADAHVLSVDTELLAALADLSDVEAAGLFEAVTETPLTERKSADGLSDYRERVAGRLRLLRESGAPTDPVDIDVLTRRLRGHSALIYQCRRDSTDGSWTVHAALATPSAGFLVHRSHITRAPRGDARACHLTAAGALDALAHPDQPQAGDLFKVGLDAPVWRELTDALIPPAWWEALLADSDVDGHELFVVPDGPLSYLPFAALLAPDGRPVVEHLTVSFLPALAYLRAEPDPAATGPVSVVVVHREPHLEGADLEEASWVSVAPHLTVREATGRKTLVDALQERPSPQAVVVSTHGVAGGLSSALQLADGTVLSAAAALNIAWPSSVFLASCWVNGMDIATGREPFAMPMACLLRGASTVIGGLVPVYSRITADIVAALVVELPYGNITSPQLRRALARHTIGRDPVWLAAEDFALMMVWAIAPSSERPATYPAALWGADGIARDDKPRTGSWSASTDFSHTLQTVLRHARSGAVRRPVSTLAFLAATVQADSQDWTSFLVACETGPPAPAAFALTSTDDAIAVHLADGHPVLVTPELFTALKEGRNAARALHSGTVDPVHVLIPALLNADTDLARWMKHQARGMDPLQALSERVLGTDLPEPDDIIGLSPQTLALEHAKRMEDSVLSGDEMNEAAEKATPAWRLSLLAAATLLALVYPQALAAVLDWPPAPGHLGVLWAQTSEPRVRGVQRGGPADQADMRPGDLVLAVDGNRVPTVAIATAAIRARRPGSKTTVTVIRAGHTIDITITLDNYPLAGNN